MSRIINESTAVVQVDSSGLQNGNTHIVYISTTTIPGQLVTVIDATGFLSSPQAIVLSTTGGATFSDGSYSTLLQQRFSYVTMVSQDTHTWSIVSESPFQNPSLAALYKSLDATSVISPILKSQGLISSGTAAVRSIEIGSSFSAYGMSMFSTMYVNALSSFISSSPLDARFTVNGPEHIYGSTITIGAGSFRGSISTGGNFFNTGNISSKLGTIYVGGDVTTMSSIRGQRGNIITAAALQTYTTAGFVGPVTIASTVTSQNFVNARVITTAVTDGVSMNTMSSIVFSPTHSIRNRPTYLEFLGIPITVPSTVSSSHLTASNAVITSNITFQSFGPATTLEGFTMGSTLITNDTGSLSISSIGANTLTAEQIHSKRTEDSAGFTADTLTMHDQVSSGAFTIGYPGGFIQVPNYWMISSVGANGTLHGPCTTISTNTLIAKSIQTLTLNTLDDNTYNFYTQHVNVRDNAMFTNVNTASIKNVFINNSRGAIVGSITETMQSIFCSSIKTDEISTGTAAIRFAGSKTFSLPNTFISSLSANNIVTSSFHVSKIITGSQELYSTINPSSPWLLTSTYQMATVDPFNTTIGLGAYFDEVSFVASKNQTAYYSIIDPSAQNPIYLSTPYVNTIAGTGINGYLSTNGQLATQSQVGLTIGQPAADYLGNIYFGTDYNGWRLQRINPTGRITTIAGNNQFFYGDGKFPLNAAFGPRLSVSLPSYGTLLITDISNVRIRYVTNDPIVTTIAGTGATGYSGDGSLALNATFSTPTTTATDSTGRTFLTDTGNQVIRSIVGSTISLYAGTPGIIGNTGDGGPSADATLNSPFGLAVDTANNLLFTDLSNCAIRKITPSGTIDKIAGTYTPGFGGDGGLAISAALSFPRGITVDPNNNIYFCDTGNARVRRIDATTQIITTVAGNGVKAYGGDGALATLASLSTPTGVTTDTAGNLYIADTDNQCVRYVNVATNIITTVAGRPRNAGYGGDKSFATFALLNSPSHIAFDRASGYYYIADDGNRRIRYVNSATRIIFTAAGNGSPVSAGDGGPATDAVFGNITSVATDTNNNIYISDGIGNNVRKINAATSTIYSVVGTGVAGFSGDSGLAGLARISSPQTLIVDSNANLYFTDMNNQRVRRVDGLTSTISTIAGSGVAGYNGDSISSIGANLNYPKGLARDATGALYVGDINNFRIRRLDPTGFITTYAGNGIQGALSTTNTFLDSIGITNGLTVDASGQLYMTEATTSGIWRFNQSTATLEAASAISTPAYLNDAGPLSNAYFNNPMGIAMDASNNFIVCDSGNYRIRRSYTFGNPQNPLYMSLSFKYTNYFTSTGSASISLNGNRLYTFYASTLQNESYTLRDANILDYPLQGSNPVYGNQVPYIEITQESTVSYAKLEGNLFAQGVPGQALLNNRVDSESGIIMNMGTLVFPYQNNGITLDNKFNDISLRNLNYTGSLLNASDPALKEGIEPANLQICYNTLASLPLRRYKYIDPYLSTFHVRDTHRMGFLTSEVEPLLPNSISPTLMEHLTSNTVMNTLDTGQIKYSHLGVTQHLIGTISTLEAELGGLLEARDKMRVVVAQRNSVH